MRRQQSYQVKSTMPPLKRPIGKALKALFTFVGGPWNGQRARLSVNFMESDVIKCSKCGCKGKYKLGLSNEQLKAGVEVRGYALAWHPA
jgi:hypothetical protein